MRCVQSTWAAVFLALIGCSATLSFAAPKYFGAFEEVPLKSVTPSGWIESELRTQAAGLSGHIEVAGYPFDHAIWEEPDPTKIPDAWSRYEQTAYWIDGSLRCSYLIHDESLLARTHAIVEYVLSHPDPDGYLGPRQYKAKKADDRESSAYQWPNVVFFRSLMAEYSETGDPKILDALTRHYLEGKIVWDLSGRGNCNNEIILWLYGKAGDQRLLDLANSFYDQYNDHGGRSSVQATGLLSDNMPRTHGVSFAEIGKLGAINYLYTGDKERLAATVNGFRKVERDHLLASGCYSSEEGLKEKDSLAAHETCDIADYTWSLGYLLMATGEAHYADSIERAIFNAGFGAISDDFKQLQYFSSPNQVISNATSSQTPMLRGNSRMSYRPGHDVECCTGNVNRMFPNYAARMWMKGEDGALAATLYGPGKVEFGGLKVSEATNYPFEETIRFTIDATDGNEHAMSFRIPTWCESAELSGVTEALKPGSFATIKRKFAIGDQITLKLPMTTKLNHWPGGGVSVSRGPLTYSLKIATDEKKVSDVKAKEPNFPALELSPAAAWNYALDVDDATIAASAKIETKPIGDHPWSADSTPVVMHLPAKKVAGWELLHETSVVQESPKPKTISGSFTMTPPLPEAAGLKDRLAASDEMVTLIPYGAAKLRVTVFPWAEFRCIDSLNESFDGQGPIGWDASGSLLLNLKNGKGEVTTRGNARGLMKSGEMLMDFSKPITFTAVVDAADGAWSLAAFDEAGKEISLGENLNGPGKMSVNLSEKTGWTGPRRFRVGFVFVGANTHVATLSSLTVK